MEQVFNTLHSVIKDFFFEHASKSVSESILRSKATGMIK